MESSFRTRRASWADDEQALRLVRQAVFIDEQNVPSEEEWDGRDEASIHLICEDRDRRPVACARLWSRGDGCLQIGRMAVLKPWRKRGIGASLMRQALSLAASLAAEGFETRLCLDAQIHAIEFYARFGFRAEGPVFDDAGIPHRQMKLVLRPKSE